jgi:hypothetical protein
MSSTYHSLAGGSLTQDWSNTGLITINDNWSNVPSIEGFLGQDITTSTGTDPQTLQTDSTVANDLDVIANQNNPDVLTTGGVAEFDGVANPTVALNGSGSADAPHLVIYLDTTGMHAVRVRYQLRDLDASTDNAVSPVALQYRVGESGNWTNVPAAFISDATFGPSSAGDSFLVDVTLPGAVDNQAKVQLRIITTNAAGNDEWIGIDDIAVSAFSNAPPVIRDDHIAAVQDTALRVDAGHGVLANDTANDTQTVVEGYHRTAAGGQIYFDGDGSYNYVSAPGFSGTDSVQYTVVDPSDNIVGAGTLTIDVAAAALLPFVSVGDQLSERHQITHGFGQVGNGVATTLFGQTALAGGGYVATIDYLDQAFGTIVDVRTYDANHNLLSVFDPGVITGLRVAPLSNGGYALAYGVRTPVDPTDPNGAYTQTISVQVFDANGHSLTGPTPFDVPGDIDALSGLAALPNGGFVLLQTSVDASVAQLYAQSFSAAGVPEAQQYAIGGSDQARNPFILPNGQIVTNRIVNDVELHLQRYDVHGNPIGGDIHPLDATEDLQSTVRVAQLAGGGFAVTWAGNFSVPDPDPNEPDHEFVRYHTQVVDANGGLVGTQDVREFEFSTIYGAPFAAITPLANGGFVTASRGEIVNGETVHRVQVFDASGHAVGSPIEFISQTAFGTTFARVYALPDGGFVIGPQAADPANHNLLIYDNSGTPVGEVRMHDPADGTGSSGFFLVNRPGGDTLVLSMSFASDSSAYDDIAVQTIRFEGTTPFIQTGTAFYEDTTGTIPVKIYIPDLDGSEIVQWIDVAGVPPGWTLSDPGATTIFDGFTWKVIGGNITHGGDIDLLLTPPSNFSGSISLAVTAHTVDTDNGSQNQSFPAPYDVTILPAPDWTRSVDVGPHPAGWEPSGIGDFNADGTSDLAWFNAASGHLDVWQLANGQWSASPGVGIHPAGYLPVGFGDFNHDGTSDVLWFNATTRDVDLWKVANGQWAGSVDIGTHPAGYAPVLTGDFNGDGTSDVLWFDAATRDVDLWKISNGQWAGSVDIGIRPDGYQPVLAGDFNGDGTSDIAWYNASTGDVDIWKIVNGEWAGSAHVGPHPAGWEPVATGDFNQDGTSDIVWHNPTTNGIDIWLIKNGEWTHSVVDLGAHPAGAAPVGVGDFDHNGVSDIMWEVNGTGHIDNWMLALS